MCVHMWMYAAGMVHIESSAILIIYKKCIRGGLIQAESVKQFYLSIFHFRLKD